MKIKKLNEIKEYRNTRKIRMDYDFDNSFMTNITINLLLNISERSSFIHSLLDTNKKIDSSLQIAIGLYICSLVTCWETFFRDLFIFISNNDTEIKKKLQSELTEIIPLELTIGEFYARKYNFQNLNNTREAFDYIFQKRTKSIVDYFTKNIFNEVICTHRPLIFKWILDGIYQEKINDVLQTAFTIRHKVTHDANYMISFDSVLFSEIECVFQMIPQFFISNIATKYSQKRLVFDVKKRHIRLTDTPSQFEKPYVFCLEDLLSDGYEVVK